MYTQSQCPVVYKQNNISTPTRNIYFIKEYFIYADDEQAIFTSKETLYFIVRLEYIDFTMLGDPSKMKNIAIEMSPDNERYLVLLCTELSDDECISVRLENTDTITPD